MINGVVAPPLLLLIVLLGAEPRIMKRHVSGKLSRTLTGAATATMALAAVLMFTTMVTGG